jgi:oligopeptidase B
MLVYSSFRSKKLIYSYQNFITPETWYELDLNNFTYTKIKQKTVKNFDASKYKVERVHIKAGSFNIPIDILSNINFEKDGTSKCLLYGYNSYGSNVDVRFDEKIFPLVDRGFIYVLSNVRGSSYLGNIYYEEGKMLKKMNTFNDFIAVSEYLLDKKYCAKDGLSIEGRSAGGLLVSAVSVLRPDLYKNVIAGVPFVDVLVTMSDGSIPLTVGEWMQWGNPNIRRYYNYILRYSPIDNLREGVCYPNYYITAGLNDPRVSYWEPAKFTAMLRYCMKRDCDRLILLKTKMDSGHFSSRDRYKNLDEIAEKYSFLISV